MTQQKRPNRKGFPSYSKVGCQQCKKSHRKCNEKTPKCERCELKLLDCQYPPSFVIDSSGDLDSDKDKQSTRRRKKTRFSAFIPQTENVITSQKDKFISKHKVVQENGSGINEQASPRPSKSMKFTYIGDMNQLSNTAQFEPISSIINNSGPDSSPTQGDSPYSLELNKVNGPPVGDIPRPRMNTLTFETIPNINTLNKTANSNDIIDRKTEEYNDKSFNSKMLELNSLFPITLEDLITITPTDIDFLNMVDIDGDNFYSLDDTYTPYPYAFDVSWKTSVTLDLVSIFQECDPIQTIYSETGDISLKDSRLLNFIWTLNRGTRYYFNFPMFPLEIYEEVMEHFSKLSNVYSIVQSVMTYDCAVLMTGVYKRSNQKDLVLLWDRYVRIPSFKQCLEILKERIDFISNFAESVVLTFAVIIIFSASGSDKIWRTHLKGSYQLLLKSLSMQSMMNPANEFDHAASRLFEILQEWFFNIEFCCQVTSDNGFHITDSMSLDNKESNNSIVILESGVTLIGGHSQELKPIMEKIRLKLFEFENRGIHLCGNNFLVFKFTNTDETLATEMKLIGIELVSRLKLLTCQYKITETSDYQMRFTLQNNDKLTRLALELYLEYFFICDKPTEFFVDLLEQILEIIYSIPYYYVVSVNWPIYQSALVALLSNEEGLYQCFYDVMYSLRTNGIYVVDNALNRLEHIKRVIANKEYDKLVDPEMDFMLI